LLATRHPKAVLRGWWQISVKKNGLLITTHKPRFVTSVPHPKPHPFSIPMQTHPANYTQAQMREE
jgi:hypothetical protein